MMGTLKRRCGVLAAAFCAVLFLCASVFVRSAYADADPAVPMEARSELDKGVSETTDTSAIDFLYLDADAIVSGGQQNVAVGFTGAAGKAVLYYQDVFSESVHAADATEALDDAALFTLDGLKESGYRLVAVSYTDASAVRQLIRLNEEQVTGSEFTVGAAEGGVQTFSLDSDSSADAGDGSVESSIFTMDENGELSEQENLTDAVGSGAASASARSATRSSSSMTVIVIDPGHGGYDPGAVGHGLQEKTLNLKIAQAIEAELKLHPDQVQVYMTRYDDRYVGLKERADFAKSVNANFFLSVHINSGGGTGVEVWVQNTSSWHADFHGISNTVGNSILGKLTSLGLTNRGAKWKDHGGSSGEAFYPDGSRADYLSVLRNCRRYGIPAALAEHGFIDKAYDASLLANDAVLAQMGKADAQAILESLNVIPHGLYGFTDVFDSTYHQEDIGWLASTKISTGFPDHTFRPMNDVARCDMAAFLYRLADSPEYEPGDDVKVRFSDVNGETYHCKEVWWLASVKVTTGFQDHTFGPYKNIVRCDMAAFLRRMSGVLTSIQENAGSENPALASQVSAYEGDASLIASAAPLSAAASGEDLVSDFDASVGSKAQPGIVSTVSTRSALEGYGTFFKDVNAWTSHAEESWWLGATGISTGFPDGAFRPMADVARCDMAAFLYRLADSPSFSPTDEMKAQFTDVDDSTPHAKEIWWLASEGIAEGFSDGGFHPYDQIKRADQAAFLFRLYEYLKGGMNDWQPDEQLAYSFTDVNGDVDHNREILWLASMGISTGFSDHTFGPYKNIVRCDMAAFLKRLSDAVDPNAFPITENAIMGDSTVSADQMVAYFEAHGVSYPSVYEEKGAPTIRDFVDILIDEAAKEGVRAEVVFAQAMKETGFLKFGGQVKKEQCNFAGIGATNGGAAGAEFPDVRTGIRAQVQHLKAYATTDALNQSLVDPRFDKVTRGIAPRITDLNGKWAVPGVFYGQSIINMINAMLRL